MLLWHLNYVEEQGAKNSTPGRGEKKNFTCKEDALYFIRQHMKKNNLGSDCDKLLSMYRLITINTKVCYRHEQLFPSRKLRPIKYITEGPIRGAGRITHG